MRDLSVEMAKEIGREPTPLDIARACRQLEYEIADIERKVGRLADIVTVLVDASYKLAEYEKKASGGYGPRD